MEKDLVDLLTIEQDIVIS